MTILHALQQLPAEMAAETLAHVDLWTLQQLAKSCTTWRSFLLTLPTPWWTQKLNQTTVGSVSHVTAEHAVVFGSSDGTPGLLPLLSDIRDVQKRDFALDTLQKQSDSSRDLLDTFTPIVSRGWTDYELSEDDELVPVDMVRVWEAGSVYDEMAETWAEKTIARLESRDGTVTVSRNGVSITVESSPLILLQRNKKQTFLHDSDSLYWVDWHRERILRLVKTSNMSDLGHVCVISGHIICSYSDSLVVIESQYPEGGSGSKVGQIIDPISSACYRVPLPANLIDKQTQGHVTVSGQHALFLFSTPHVRGFVVDLNKKTVYKADIGDLGCQSPIYGLTEGLGLSVDVVGLSE
ncbi:YALIA101S08e00320g1_1 [Yarrowia lipolytica]|nr:YALIA101S08e00320g1_1 [Yarrowia lipolytica]